MAHYQLAQLDIATLKYPLESPEMADFAFRLPFAAPQPAREAEVRA